MLPIFKDDNQTFMLHQTEWAQQLNTLLSNPICNGILLSDLSLTSGTNKVNHKLGRKLQGWIVVGRNNAATIYDTQSTNSMPDKTLNLVTSGAITLSLYVF